MKIINEINKFYKIYPKQKSSVNLANLWRYIFINPISIIVAFILTFFKIKPITITLVSFIIGLFALYNLFNSNFLLGSILLNISYLFDCVDGHLARYYNATSMRGQFFDDVSGIIIWTFAWPCLGFGLYFYPDVGFQSLFYELSGYEFNNIFFILLGLVAGFCNELRTLISFKFLQIKKNISQKELSKNKYESRGFIYTLYKNVISVGGLVAPIFIISSLLNINGFILLIYFSIYLLVFTFYSLIYYFRL
tara:strand:+ start:1108 stop:1857 length:750 start_codon:yes stop_codon:yes gene_type:complete